MFRAQHAQPVFHWYLRVKNQDAFDAARTLARVEGMLVGISAGANFLGALQLARKLGKGKNVVTIMCDTGERYLSTGIFD